MKLENLRDTPPWDWPKDTGKTIRKALTDQRAKASDRLVAAELAGELTVINDDLASELLAILGRGDEPEQLRAKAAISLGPVLDLAATDGSTSRMMSTLANVCSAISGTNSTSFTSTLTFQNWYGGEFWKHRCAPPMPGIRARSRRHIPAETRSGG